MLNISASDGSDFQVKTATETGIIEGAATKEEGEHGKRAPHGKHQVSLDQGDDGSSEKKGDVDKPFAVARKHVRA